MTAFLLLVTGSAHVSRVGRRLFVCGTQDDKGGHVSAAAGHTRADCRDPGALAVKYFPSLLMAAVNGSHTTALMAHQLHTCIAAYPTSPWGNLIGILKSVCQEGPSPSAQHPISAVPPPSFQLLRARPGVPSAGDSPPSSEPAGVPRTLTVMWRTPPDRALASAPTRGSPAEQPGIL